MSARILTDHEIEALADLDCWDAELVPDLLATVRHLHGFRENYRIVVEHDAALQLEVTQLKRRCETMGAERDEARAEVERLRPTRDGSCRVCGGSGSAGMKVVDDIGPERQIPCAECDGTGLDELGQAVKSLRASAQTNRALREDRDRLLAWARRIGTASDAESSAELRDMAREAYMGAEVPS